MRSSMHSPKELLSSMEPEESIDVEVVFALAERQVLVAVAVPPGTTAGEAIDISGIASEFPEENLSAFRLGVWGRLVERDQVLQAGDRIEIYRPLKIDPREARRRLAAEGKSMGRTENDSDKA